MTDFVKKDKNWSRFFIVDIKGDGIIQFKEGGPFLTSGEEITKNSETACK